jgi:hypothetical protein
MDYTTDLRHYLDGQGRLKEWPFSLLAQGLPALEIF